MTESECAAPKLPPRTYKKNSVTSKTSRQPHKIIDENEYTSEKLVYEKELPQMVVVTSGYDGATPENCVSVGEEFVIVFVKSTYVLPARLVGDTEEIHIPIDSMLSVGIVRKGGAKVFSTVKDILKLSKLPMVVEVKCAFTSNNYHVEKGTILYIKGRDGKTALLCHNESDGQDLTLSPNVVGKFSTDPDDATIFITDYTTMFKDYPVTVKLLQKGVDVDDHLAQYIGQTFVLEEPIEKLSLIAITDVNGTRSIDNPATVEIPMDIPLSFKRIERPELGMERVYNIATEVCKEFNLSKIDVLYGARVVSENDYYEIRYPDDNDYEDFYVAFDVICPNPRGETMKKAVQTKNQVNNPGKETPNLKKRAAAARLKSSAEKKSHDNATTAYENYTIGAAEDLAGKLEAEKDRVKQLTDDNDQLTTEMDSLKMQLHFSEQNCGNLEAELERVKKNITKLSSQLEQLTDKKESETSSEENIKKLRKMTTTDISDLLKHMSYQMYAESFSVESVDGMLLSTLEEEHLKELGIKNSIHCRRLMNIIQGKESVDKYF